MDPYSQDAQMHQESGALSTENESQDLPDSEGLPQDSLSEPESNDSVEEKGEEEDRTHAYEEQAIPPEAKWYVIHSYSGYENKVEHNLNQRIASMGMQNKIFRVVVPTEEEVEIRDGKRRSSRRRVFPGYILVQMILDDESWYVVRNTPGVTGFVGSGTKPIPLRQEEVDKILARMEEEHPRIRVNFRVGETVRIVEGPFADFMATVDEIYPERGKVRLLVSFFGRETPVEMDFLQVEKI